MFPMVRLSTLFGMLVVWCVLGSSVMVRTGASVCGGVNVIVAAVPFWVLVNWNIVVMCIMSRTIVSMFSRVG